MTKVFYFYVLFIGLVVQYAQKLAVFRQKETAVATGLVTTAR